MQDRAARRRGRMSEARRAYLDAVIGLLERARDGSTDAMTAAADAIERSVRAGGLVYAFGTGHSHMLAEELHYRAGGPAFVVPVLSALTGIAEGAVSATALERTPGLAGPVLGRYGIEPRDCLLVVSNSGVNAAPLEAARHGREVGCTVIALTSLAYSSAAAQRERLADLADVVLDNAIPSGDAVIPLPGTELRAGPASTAIGAAILQAVLADVAARLAADGPPPIYLSANMPGAEEHNRALVERNRGRNRHL